MLKRPFLLAAELGVHEVVKAIIELFPDAIWVSDTENHNVLQLAVMNRREKVFKLIFQMSHHKHLLLMSKDNFGNNILHLAGKLAPQKSLDHIYGAAMLFTEEHEKLVKEGEKWMKGAASSCTVVAAVIATVVFAAAITVLGGNDDDGLPNFYNESAFNMFYYSNLFSLYTSVMSVLIFLSVLTSRKRSYGCYFGD
ncbi:hypothetical protein Pint_12025 [Pistacia integerrima]|uniref:Uncharacterized protein n=1 Tax=Pistacia integerrima TaxID=434235 RepID=A0ACC0XL85_9ROSI|nr:hypothetical protein Pint_12025 [Pistacia integerrima]